MTKKIVAKKLTAKFRMAATTNSKRVHVVSSNNAWAVKKEGSKNAFVVRATKASAIEAAKNVKSVSRIVIHKMDGTIQKKSKKKS